MACACKNKIQHVENSIPNFNNYESSNKSFQNIFKKIGYSFLGIFGRIFMGVLIFILMPFIISFLIIKIIFFPEKQIIINIDKLVKRWTKHTE